LSNIPAHELSDALRIGTPGSGPPAQHLGRSDARTGVPAFAFATTSRMMGEWAAMAPVRR
jgi:hypothetical protein